MSDFDGFSKELIHFFQQLKTNNSKNQQMLPLHDWLKKATAG
jgi:hypothetical protein